MKSRLSDYIQMLLVEKGLKDDLSTILKQLSSTEETQYLFIMIASIIEAELLNDNKDHRYDAV